MIEGLIWIIALYGSAIAAVHLIHRQTRGRKGARTHYVLWVEESQLQMEWILRSIQMWHWMRGQQLRITIVSERASEETMDIASKLLQRWGIDYRIVLPVYLPERLIETPCEERVVEIRLRPVEDLKRLQLFG